MQEDHFETKIKLSKFWLMLYNSFQIFGCVFILYRLFQDGCNDKAYIQDETKVRHIFIILELAPFLELLHHFVGIQKMKTHIFVNMLTHAWILFGVIEYDAKSQMNSYVLHWVLIRCVNKIIRHFYNAYVAMDLRFEVYVIDYVRMTSYYLCYVLEYAYTLLLVISNLAVVQENNKLKANSAESNLLNFHFDYQLVYFFYICASIPNFINTFAFLHRKRNQQLQHARNHAHSKHE